MDRIFLRDLKIETVIGIFEWERRIRQTVSLDIELATDVQKAARADSIDGTLNYKQIAKRLIAFVEVKTRRSRACGSAVESVSAFKQRILGRVATLWRVRHGRPGDEYRFDVVAVVWPAGAVHAEIRHEEHAFE